ncbi:ABC transporter permease [Lachnospiraceae bacterium 38-10]
MEKSRKGALQSFRELKKGENSTQITMLIAFVVMFVLFSTQSGTFYSLSNILNVLRQNSALFLIACGQTYVIMLAGIDLSQGNLVGLCSVISSYAMLRFGFGAGLLAGLLVSVLCGAVTGTIIVKGKVQPFVAALGMQFIIYGVNLLISGGNPVYNLPEAVSWIGSASVLGIPVSILIAFVVGMAAHILLKKSTFGRGMYAVGGNNQAAHLSGISVKRTIIKAWLLNGVLIGVGSMILMSRVGSGQPALGGAEIQMQSIAAAVVGGNSFDGGKGSISATLIGALFIAFLINGLNILGLNQFVREVIMGAVIILSVIKKGKAES